MYAYIKQIQTDLKGVIDKNTIIVKDFNTPLSIMGRSSRSEINKEMLDLTDIYRTFYPTAAEYTFFSRVYGTC